MINLLKKFGGEIIRLVLFASVLGAVGASGAVWQWSQTPGNNGSSDPHISWAIGMAPSAVGASSRAEMAELAKYRDDISGLVATGGSSTAYTITSNQGLASTPNDGQLIAFTPHTANGINATLAVDGGTAYQIQISPGAVVPSGTLIQGTPYHAKFMASQPAWILFNTYNNAYQIPLGGYLFSSTGVAPNSNFVQAIGSCISRTTYAAYFALVGTAYGACDGSTTFGVPDLRGRVAAMLDGGTGRLTGNSGCGGFTLGTTCGSETQTLTIAQLPTGITSSGSNSITVTPTGTAYTGIPVTTAAANVTQSVVTNGSNSFVPASTSGSWAGVNSMSGNNTINVTSNNTSGSAHPIVQPTFGVNVYVRIF